MSVTDRPPRSYPGEVVELYAPRLPAAPAPTADAATSPPTGRRTPGAPGAPSHTADRRTSTAPADTAAHTAGRPISTAPRAGGGPRWAGYGLAACGILLLPWMVVLAGEPRWALAWVGLDSMEAVGLVATGLLTVRRHPARGPVGAATAMLLVADAWFDVTTSSGGDFRIALLMAAAAELPLAAACAYLSVRAAYRQAPDGLADQPVRR